MLATYVFVSALLQLMLVCSYCCSFQYGCIVVIIKVLWDSNELIGHLAFQVVVVSVTDESLALHGAKPLSLTMIIPAGNTIHIDWILEIELL